MAACIVKVLLWKNDNVSYLILILCFYGYICILASLYVCIKKKLIYFPKGFSLAKARAKMI